MLIDPENDLNYYDIPVDINTLDEKQLDHLEDSHGIDDSVSQYSPFVLIVQFQLKSKASVLELRQSIISNTYFLEKEEKLLLAK